MKKSWRQTIGVQKKQSQWYSDQSLFKSGHWCITVNSNGYATVVGFYASVRESALNVSKVVKRPEIYFYYFIGIPVYTATKFEDTESILFDYYPQQFD